MKWPHFKNAPKNAARHARNGRKAVQNTWFCLVAVIPSLNRRMTKSGYVTALEPSILTTGGLLLMIMQSGSSSFSKWTTVSLPSFAAYMHHHVDAVKIDLGVVSEATSELSGGISLVAKTREWDPAARDMKLKCILTQQLTKLSNLTSCSSDYIVVTKRRCGLCGSTALLRLSALFQLHFFILEFLFSTCLSSLVVNSTESSAVSLLCLHIVC